MLTTQTFSFVSEAKFFKVTQPKKDELIITGTVKRSAIVRLRRTKDNCLETSR